MRVVVTGHQGYLGSVLVPLLRQAGHEVDGIDTGLFAECRLGPSPCDVPGRALDVRDIGAADLRGADAVVHLAGLCNDPLGDLDAALTLEINGAASVRLGEEARDAGVRRFVLASSCSVYGAPDGECNEQTATDPLTPYASSKLEAERGLAALAGETFEPVALRFGTAYGFSPRLRFDLVVNNLVAWALATGRVRLKSDGNAWRGVVHVEDAARATLGVVEAPADAVAGRALNVCTENRRVRELATLVADAVPGARVETVAEPVHDHRSYRVSAARLAQALPGFAARWDVAAGARQLRDALGDGPQVDDFEGPRYSRLKHLQRLRAEGRVDASLRPVTERWLAPRR